MSDAYNNVIGGSLKLKDKVVKKRKLKKKAEDARAAGDAAAAEPRAPEDAAAGLAKLTKAEREHLRILERNARKLAESQKDRSYRDRIADRNDHLASLSEHHDMPRVSKH